MTLTTSATFEKKAYQLFRASIAETGKMLNGLINSMRPKLAERKSA